MFLRAGYRTKVVEDAAQETMADGDLVDVGGPPGLLEGRQEIAASFVAIGVLIGQ